jgi:uncharacterized protein (DUF433 family)
MVLTLKAEPVPLRIDADGVVRVVGSRVTLDTIIAAFDEGATPEQIMQDYSSLDLMDIYAVIAYSLRHRPEVDVYLRERARQAEEVREQVAARFDQRGLRERLLARRRERDGESG